MGNKYEKIILKHEDYNLELEIKDSILQEMYRENPERFEKIITGHMVSACGDIFSGENLDSLIENINYKAEKEKLKLLDIVQKRQQALNN